MAAVTDSMNLGIKLRHSPRAQAAYQMMYEHFEERGTKVAEGSAVTVDLSGRGALIEMPCDLEFEGSLFEFVSTPFSVGVSRGSVLHSHQMTNPLFRAGIQLKVIEKRCEVKQALGHHALEDKNG